MEQSPRAELEESMQYHHPEKTLAELPAGQEIADEMLARSSARTSGLTGRSKGPSLSVPAVRPRAS
jgi:hypothetical protein